MREVEVITSFNLEGYPKPHRFRIDEDDALVVINITSSFVVEDNKAYKYIKYRCNCIIQNATRSLDMIFYKDKMKWYINM